MAEKKKKSIFDKAVDALTDRDEKAAATEAEASKKLQAEKILAEAKKAQEARVKAEAAAKAKADAAKLSAEKAKLSAEKAKVDAAQKDRQVKLAKAQKDQADRLSAKKAELEQKKLADAAAKAAIVKHVWTNEDTYASLAFKHYGSIKEPYWRLIYEHNKHIIGNHPNHIKTGTEIEIPPLPEELKKK
jgi:nucleoid-associated protein YgaU